MDGNCQPDLLAQHEQGEKAGPIGRPSGLPARGCVAREQSAVGHAEVTLRCMAVTLMRRTDALIFLMVLSLALARGIDIGAEEHRFLHVLVDPFQQRSEEHTSELQSLMRISYAVFCLKK